jgi:hypothetical protein
MKSLQFLGLVVLAGPMLYGQPTTGAQYWSTTVPDCSSLGENAATITNAAGTTVGYSCYVSGTFLWLAAGGTWSSSIRVAAPASGAIGVDYAFYDTSGNNLSLDATIGSSAFPASGNDVNFALNANQPSEVRLLGAQSDAPRYGNTQTGTVYAVFYCPNANTCQTVLPQLLYSFIPIKPWSLSVPISWDYFFSPVQAQGAWPQWSAEGVDDGGTHLVSLVIYNEDTLATSYTVRVYDSSGSLVGTGTTPSIPPVPVHSDGTFGEGGTYGALLSQVITTPLPTGVFKVLIDGGSNYSAVAVLQFNGDSATSLQVAYDSAPNTSSAALTTMRSSARPEGVPPRPRHVFAGLPK